MSQPEFDAKDREILADREAAFNALSGPRVGDWCIMPNEEKPRRFSHDWGDAIQTSWPKHGTGSIYLGQGYASYSGSLDPSLPKIALIDTGERRPGQFWFFHHDHSRAHNGVHFEIDCRVYRYNPSKNFEIDCRVYRYNPSKRGDR